MSVTECCQVYCKTSHSTDADLFVLVALVKMLEQLRNGSRQQFQQRYQQHNVVLGLDCCTVHTIALCGPFTCRNKLLLFLQATCRIHCLEFCWFLGWLNDALMCFDRKTYLCSVCCDVTYNKFVILLYCNAAVSLIFNPVLYRDAGLLILHYYGYPME